MSESTSVSDPLVVLIQLASVDGLIFGLETQKKRLGDEYTQRRQAVDAQRSKHAVRSKMLDERRTLCTREEKAVKAERDKVNERRRALGTLNNYKVQQAAEREIEFVAKQIGKREDMVLALMREVEVLEKEVTELTTALTGAADELAAAEKEVLETVNQIEARLSEYRTQRSALAQELANTPALSLYNRVQGRYPNDPVVKVGENGSCQGCHMRVGPQIVVQISRGDVVKCPGCGRILSLPSQKEGG